MDKHFKAIVENGYQFLQTPRGERVNYLTKTNIAQTNEKVAECVFSLNVNFKNSGMDACFYNKESKILVTPMGEVLYVEFLEYSPKTETTLANLTAKCTVVFPYETMHKELTTNNQEIITA